MNKTYLLITAYFAEGINFDQEAFVELFKSPLNSISNACILLVPTFFFVRTAFDVIKYYAQDEQERQQAPLQRRIKQNILWMLFGLSLGIILKIFGLSW